MDPDERERSVEYLKEAIDVAAEAGSSFLNVIPERRDDTLNPA
jgi:sugar phosphate isomerase/epimerase